MKLKEEAHTVGVETLSQSGGSLRRRAAVENLLSLLRNFV